MIVCAVCETTLTPTSKFCRRCGARVESLPADSMVFAPADMRPSVPPAPLNVTADTPPAIADPSTEPQPVPLVADPNSEPPPVSLEAPASASTAIASSPPEVTPDAVTTGAIIEPVIEPSTEIVIEPITEPLIAPATAETEADSPSLTAEPASAPADDGEAAPVPAEQGVVAAEQGVAPLAVSGDDIGTYDPALVSLLDAPLVSDAEPLNDPSSLLDAPLASDAEPLLLDAPTPEDTAMPDTPTTVVAEAATTPPTATSHEQGEPPTSMPDVSSAASPTSQVQLAAQETEGRMEQTTSQPAVNPTQPLVAPSALVDPILAPGTVVEDYTIVELREERPDERIYRAQALAEICQQCGTRAALGNQFCEECGAELLPHDVFLYERDLDAEGEPTGPWRMAALPDEPIRTLLPPVTVFEVNQRRYLVAEENVPGYRSLAELLADQGNDAQQPAALDEDDALPIALQLARLLDFLHHNGTALGDLSLAQLLIGPKQALRLRDVSQMQLLSDGTRKADLQQLARTLEELTRTPRATQKLEDNAATVRSTTLNDVLLQGRLGTLPDAAAWVGALDTIARAKAAIKPLRTVVGAQTNVGMVRKVNEDSFFYQETRLGLVDQILNAGVYVVADGMGGHEAGEVASRLAVLAVSQTVAAQLADLAADAPQGIRDETLSDIVVAAADAANTAVFQEGQRRGNDMGTTLTFGLVVGDRCVVGNVGDSRTYLLHQGTLKRISRDHSLVMRLVDVGQITEEEIYTHPHRNAILRSLGDRPTVEVDTFPLRLEAGDALFCVSDGQWELVRDKRMNDMLNSATDPQAVADQLQNEANQNGGEDNITALIVRFV